MAVETVSSGFREQSLHFFGFISRCPPATSLRLPPGSKRHLLQTICFYVQHMPPLVTGEKKTAHGDTIGPLQEQIVSLLPSPFIHPDAEASQVRYSQFKRDKENQLVATEQTELKWCTRKLNRMAPRRSIRPGNIKFITEVL